MLKQKPCRKFLQITSYSNKIYIHSTHKGYHSTFSLKIKQIYRIAGYSGSKSKSERTSLALIQHGVFASGQFSSMNPLAFKAIS